MNINQWTTSTVTLNAYTLASTTGTILSGKSGSGPTNIIYSILSQLDVDQVDQDYLGHIQTAVAPYVPIPSYMSTTSTATVNPAPFYTHLSDEERAFLRAQLYRKIIKYFYNTRGSRNSAISFFRIFYNDTASIYDANDYLTTVQSFIQTWLTSSGMTLASTVVSAGASVYGQTPVQAWTPFSYVITTGVPGGSSTFDVTYRALVHPVGFKYVVQSTVLTNGIIEISQSRMADARSDYQTALWFLDPTQLTEYGNYIISDAGAIYNEANQNTGVATTSGYTYADWSNIGAGVRYNLTNMLGLSSYNYLTTPITSTSFYSIYSGKGIRNMTSSSAIPYNTTIVSTNVVNLTVPAVTISSASTQLTNLFPDPTIIPGLFVSASGIPLNTYVVSTSIITGSATVYKSDVTTNSGNLVTFLQPNAGVLVGMSVSGTGIAAGTTIAAISVSTSIVVLDAYTVGVNPANEIDFPITSTNPAYASVVPGLYITDTIGRVLSNTTISSVNTNTSGVRKLAFSNGTSSNVVSNWSSGQNTLTFSKFVVVLSSTTTSAVSGNVIFSSIEKETVVLSTAATSSVSTASVTFYGGVINLSGTGYGITSLTDRIEIDA
jgi:hypothetical protein